MNILERQHCGGPAEPPGLSHPDGVVITWPNIWKTYKSLQLGRTTSFHDLEGGCLPAPIGSSRNASISLNCTYLSSQQGDVVI